VADGEDTTMEDVTRQLSGRERAILRAVAAGSAELTGGREPDLLLDGRYCCDQGAVHRLVRAGLIAPARVCAVGDRAPARVTTAGRLELIDGADVAA
jgi:hypothetical protein